MLMAAVHPGAMAQAFHHPIWQPSQPLPADEQEDWLEGLREWIQLCQRGHEPREAWTLLERSQATLS